MDTTITFVSGIGEKPYPVLSAYDDTAALTLSGLTVPAGSYVYVTTRDGQTALANRALVATGAATVNLNTSAIDAIFADQTRSANYPCLVTVRAIATGKIVGWCLAEVAPAASPNVDVVRVGIDYATTADIADLQSQIDDLAAAVAAHEQDHPAPKTRDARNEAAGVAASTMTAHADAHPVPTIRDPRNHPAQTPADGDTVLGAIVPDFSASLTLRWTLSGNVTSFGLPIGMVAGVECVVYIDMAGYGMPANPAVGYWVTDWDVSGGRVVIVIHYDGTRYYIQASSPTEVTA